MPNASPDPEPAIAVPVGAVTGEFTDATGTRAWRLFIPAADGRAAGAPRALIVVLHGCTQDPDDIARGTRLDALADSAGAYVLYPGQPATANPKKCWNWYDPAHQRRDAGEPASIAALTQKIQAEHPIDPARTTIAGISAGGAMALITSAAYPERYAAVGVHSALPWGAAANVTEALAAMSQGAGSVPAARDRITGVALANAITQAAGSRARPMPVIVLYGADDKVVNAANGDLLVTQLADAWVQLSPNARYAAPTTDTFTVRDRPVTRTRAVGGNVEGWRIAGLGHAWSGGSPDGTFTDASGPDASAVMLAFLLAHALPASEGAGR